MISGAQLCHMVYNSLEQQQGHLSKRLTKTGGVVDIVESDTLADCTRSSFKGQATNDKKKTKLRICWNFISSQSIMQY